MLAVFAAAAMAGVPLLNGFLSKEMFFAESLAVTGLGMFNVVVPLGALLAGLFGVAYSTRFIHDVFFGQALTPLAHEPHEPLRWMRWPVEVLVLLCIAVGSFPAWTISGILDAAAVSAAGAPMPAYSLRLWHGFNLPLLMSGIAFVVRGDLREKPRRRLNFTLAIMTEDERWVHLVALDDELLKGGVILSERCTFIVRDAETAFTCGAHLAAILTAVSGIETYLRSEPSKTGRERLVELINSGNRCRAEGRLTRSSEISKQLGTC